jgi:transcriptional regulator with XRE-family HTH domain
VANPPTVPFARLLRQMRVDAGLTQEELAAAATLSPRSISDLERGINLTPRRETTRLLANALRLAGPARSAFEAAARRRVAGDGLAEPGLAVTGIAAATRTLPHTRTSPKASSACSGASVCTLEPTSTPTPPPPSTTSTWPPPGAA